MYYTKLTPVGAAKLAAAVANKTTLKLSQIALGDGGGAAVPQPTGNEKGLVREVYRSTITELLTSTTDPTIVIASTTVAPDKGGFYIRELEFIDEDGDLIAYGNFPETYKPLPADGATRDMKIQAALKVGNANLVQLTIDVSIVGATREWVAQYFAPIDSPEFTGTPKAPTPAKGDRSALIPSTQWVGNEFAPIDSPTLTGTPKTPAPVDGDSSDRIPTTSWCVRLVESMAGNYVIDTGVANAPVVALNPPITAYTGGLTVSFRARYSNTDTCTLNAGGGAVPLKRDDGTALQAGDIQAGAVVSAVYDKPLGLFLVTSIVMSQLGAAAKLGLGNGLMNDGAGNIAVSGPTYLSAAATLQAGTYLVDTAAGAFAVALPPAPAKGIVITLIDASATWGTNNLTLSRNGKTIMAKSEDLIVNMSDQQFSIWWNGTDWRLV